MGVILLILGFLLLIIGVMFRMAQSEYPFDLLFIVVGTSVVVICFIHSIDKNNPTAIDVYRDRTTLEITYRDGVPVDSTVVFKQKQ